MVGKSYSPLAYIVGLLEVPLGRQGAAQVCPYGSLLGAVIWRTKSCWLRAFGTGLVLGMHLGDLDEMVFIDPS